MVNWITAIVLCALALLIALGVDIDAETGSAEAKSDTFFFVLACGMILLALFVVRQA